MGSQGFRNIAGNPFVYQEDTRTAAIGLDLATATWKVSVLATTGALPTTAAQITIDPAVAGNITLTPNASVVISTFGVAGIVTNSAAGVLSTTATIGVPLGGTGVATLLDHGLLVGSGVAAIDSLAVGVDGQILIANTTADPSWSSTPTVTTIYATNFDTNVAAAAVTLSGTTLSADGTDAAININITAKGTGQVIIDDLQLTTDLAVTEGGTGASTFTDHGVLYGQAAAAFGVTAAGATGEVLIGTTANAPSWLAAGTDNKVLTAHTGAAPTWETPSGGSLGVNDQTASYELILTDANKIVIMTVAGANTLTVPEEATIAFPVGTQVLVAQGGAGVTTIVAHVGVTIRSAGGLMALFAQYSVCSLVKVGADLWYATGDLG